MTKKKPPTYEDYSDVIDTEIAKRRNKWNLTALAWMDFDDVSQIIRIHIYKKWTLYDSSKSILPWINRIISNQLKNLIRNHYGNFARPCLRCAAAEGEDLCTIYTKQCAECPLYAHWEKFKKRAHDTKLALPLENHTKEVSSKFEDSIDIEKTAEHMHERMELILKPLEWQVYKFLYIEGKDEKELAKTLGYSTSEKNRGPGYKHIKNIKKNILVKVKKMLADGEIDLY
jgi:RNA polymerase sigma factor (sigma-70 family)